MQKAILAFVDNDDGTLGISMEFVPDITDETRSGAAHCAIKCMEFITDKLSSEEVSHA